MTAAAIAQLIAELGPIALQFFLAIESRLNLGPDEKQNIANAIAAANAADQDVINRVGAWMAANGFEAQVQFVAKPAK